MLNLTTYLAIIATVAFILCIIVYNWKRRYLYLAASKYCGPPALPLIGNGIKFLGDHNDIFTKFIDVAKEYGSLEPVRLWLGPTLFLMFTNPEHVEKLLASPKLARKHEIYDYFKVFFGEGLVISSGPKHKQHRKIIQPILDLNFAQESSVVFQKHIEVCMDKFEQCVNQGIFNADSIIHTCIIDIAKEILFGCDERCQLTGENKFDRAMTDTHHLGRIRGAKPYLHPDLIYNITSYKKRQDEMQEIIRSKGKSIVQASIERRKQKNVREFYPLVDRLMDYMENNPEDITEDELIDHIIILHAATEDPIYTTASCLVLCLGMYPEYQEKAAQEIRDIFGDTPRPVTMDDISKLNYIKMCLKDAIRLFPSGLMTLRKCTDDLEIEKWTVPKDAAVAVPIFIMHKDKRFWENPEHFHPDHFLPEIENNRHPSAYLPFSTGPRGCVGKIVANTGVKIFICNFLQRFEVEVVGKIPDLKVKMDVSVRPKHGYKMKLKKRIWK